MRIFKCNLKPTLGRSLSILLTAVCLFGPPFSQAEELLCQNIFEDSSGEISSLKGALTKLRGKAKPGSCKVTCDDLVKKLFTQTHKSKQPLRLDIYNVYNLHFHVRTKSGVIIDPTLYQFFNFNPNTPAPIFIGSKITLIREIDNLKKSLGLREQFSGLSNKSSEEIFDFFWGRAKLYKSGENLKYFEELETSLYE